MNAADWKSLFPKQAAALESANARGRRGQAYFFIGDSTQELQAFANGWIMTAACQKPNQDGSACGCCDNCRRCMAGSYIECIQLAPESKKATIPVDRIREFNRFMSLAAPPGKVMVGIITEASAMEKEAANAFLKTLEEPSENTMFILLTTRPQFVLPTIKSRCQCLQLRSNKTDYSALIPPPPSKEEEAAQASPSEELLKLLATIHRGAGTRVALNASRELAERFEELNRQATRTVKARLKNDPEYQMGLENAKKDRAAWEEQQKSLDAKVFTEYDKLRGAYLDTIQAWFRQRYLVAAGTPEQLLPQQEFVKYMKDTPVPTREEAEADIREVETLRKALRFKIPDELALDAMTLAICEIQR